MYQRYRVAKVLLSNLYTVIQGLAIGYQVNFFCTYHKGAFRKDFIVTTPIVFDHKRKLTRSIIGLQSPKINFSKFVHQIFHRWRCIILLWSKAWFYHSSLFPIPAPLLECNGSKKKRKMGFFLCFSKDLEKFIPPSRPQVFKYILESPKYYFVYMNKRNAP